MSPGQVILLAHRPQQRAGALVAGMLALFVMVALDFWVPVDRVVLAVTLWGALAAVETTPILIRK
jgi:hypothetical protein